MTATPPLWTPSDAQVRSTRIHRFLQFVNERHGLALDGYFDLHAWSVADKQAFWVDVWDFCGVLGERGERVLVNGEQMEKALWFPDARLNFAENLLQEPPGGPDTVVMHFRAEDQVAYTVTHAQLLDRVSRIAAWLRKAGIRSGDRVAGYLPNMPETVIAMLAATSLGAVWTSTSPDFGEDSVIERFGQTGPRILFSRMAIIITARFRTFVPGLQPYRRPFPALSRWSRSRWRDWRGRCPAFAGAGCWRRRQNRCSSSTAASISRCISCILPGPPASPSALPTRRVVYCCST